jgi:hypothetical protein
MFRQPGGPPIPALQLLWPTRLQPLADLINTPDEGGDAR